MRHNQHVYSADGNINDMLTSHDLQITSKKGMVMPERSVIFCNSGGVSFYTE
jgi:hypothetical protein